MKRVFLVAALVLVVGAGAAVYFLYSSLDSIVKVAIEKVGSDVTGTPVRVGKVKISLASGEGSLGGLRVENPEGFQRGSAFQFDEILMKIDIGTITKDPVVIQEIVIQHPRIRYEIGANETNVGRIQKNVVGHSPKGGTAGESRGKAPNVIIRDLYFRDGEVVVAQTAFLKEGITVPLPEVHLTNIGSGDQGGATPGDVAKAILGNLAGAVTKAVGSMGIGELGQTAVDGLKRGNGNLGGGVKDATDQAKEFGKKMGDIFQKKK